MAIYYPLYPELIKNAKTAADYLIWTPLLLNPAKIEYQAKFQERFKKRYGKDINNQNGAGYDGMLGVFVVFQKASSLDPKKVVDAIAKTDYRAVLGRYQYDLDRHELRMVWIIFRSRRHRSSTGKISLSGRLKWRTQNINLNLGFADIPTRLESV